MTPEKNKIKELIQRDIQGLLSAQEAAYLRTLQRMYDRQEWEEIVADAVFDLTDAGYEPPGWEQMDDAKEVMGRIGHRRLASRQNRRLFFTRAAALILLCAVACWSIRDTVFPFGKPTVAQTAKCDSLLSANLLPLHDFGVSFSTKDPSAVQRDRQIQPGEVGLLERQGIWAVLRDGAGRIQLRRITDRQQQTSLPSIVAWVFKVALAQSGGRHGDIHRMHPAMAEDGVFSFSTAAQQQAEIELPGGMTIRINSGSSLRYEAEGTIALSGEGYVVQEEPLDAADRLPLETGDLLISSPSRTARYTLRTTEYGVQIILLEGTLRLTSKHTGQEWTLDRKDTSYQWSLTRLTTDSPEREMMASQKLPHYARPLAWTLPIREYDRIHLKEYILEMARWYGVEVVGLECVDDQFIRAKTCYRNQLDQFIEGLQGVGVTEARYMNGTVSLCKAHTGPPVAR